MVVGKVMVGMIDKIRIIINKTCWKLTTNPCSRIAQETSKEIEQMHRFLKKPKIKGVFYTW